MTSIEQEARDPMTDPLWSEIKADIEKAAMDYAAKPSFDDEVNIDRERHDQFVSVMVYVIESTNILHKSPRAKAESAEPVANVRPAVRWFAEQMEARLRENDYKGGWIGHTGLINRLFDEANELIEAENRVVAGPMGLKEHAGVVFEAADVANFAMMIADNYGPRIGDQRTNPAPKDASPAASGQGVDVERIMEVFTRWANDHRVVLSNPDMTVIREDVRTAKDDLRSRLASLGAADPWIPVATRLPDMRPDDGYGSITYASEPCIVLTSGGEVFDARLGKDATPNDQTPYWFGGNCGDHVDVTHWMPLPPGAGRGEEIDHPAP